MQTSLEIEIPADIRNTIYEGLSQLRDDYPTMQWVKPQNYRLVLFNFQDRYPVDYLDSKIRSATFDIPSFTLFSNTLKLTIKSSIAIYLSFYECKELIQIVKHVKSQLSIQDNLVFYPDIVVCKYKIPSKQQYLLLKKKCLKTRIETEFRITQLTLYNSVNENYNVVNRKEADYPLVTE